jgi:hypothetical protein
MADSLWLICERVSECIYAFAESFRLIVKLYMLVLTNVSSI